MVEKLENAFNKIVKINIDTRLWIGQVAVRIQSSKPLKLEPYKKYPYKECLLLSFLGKVILMFEGISKHVRHREHI